MGESAKKRTSEKAKKRISEKAKKRMSEKADLRITCMANITQTSICFWVACPGMNSGSDTSQTTRFSAVGSSFENRDQRSAVSESARKRKGENHLCGKECANFRPRSGHYFHFWMVCASTWRLFHNYSANVAGYPSPHYPSPITPHPLPLTHYPSLTPVFVLCTKPAIISSINPQIKALR